MEDAVGFLGGLVGVLWIAPARRARRADPGPGRAAGSDADAPTPPSDDEPVSRLI